VILCDVNVLVYAHKEGSPRHTEYRSWLTERLVSDEAFGVCDLVLSGFLRVVTHRRIFDPPSGWAVALDFAEAVRGADNAVPVSPGRRHWRIFRGLADETGARGNALPDAYLAAIAIESGAEWISADRGFARYPGLRWRHPLDG
jgi:toxin-antitoxin system PIN domain toxin